MFSWNEIITNADFEGHYFLTANYHDREVLSEFEPVSGTKKNQNTVCQLSYIPEEPVDADP